MKFETKAVLGVLSVCLLFATPALAQEEEEVSRFARNGPYLGASARGASFVRIDEINDGFDADEIGGFSLMGGYRVTPIMALEVQYDWLSKADVDLDGSGNVGDLEAWSLTANMKVFFWTGRFQPYAVAGLGGMQADFNDSTGFGLGGTESDFAFRFGAGLDFYITESVVATVGADYLLPTGSDLEDLDYVSYGGGIAYRF